MGKSTVQFQRWKCREQSTWPFQVFQRYNHELDRIFSAQISAQAFVYKQLKKSGAAWTDDPQQFFTLNHLNLSDLYSDLKDWSSSYNLFGNWTRLNFVIALNSNLETYLASVISLALDSDPGQLLGISKRVDGVSVLKYGTAKVDYEQRIIACTKGDWQSRLKAFECLFGQIPPYASKYLGELEKVRILRNKVGHAFGRDIEEARKYGVKEILPMETLKMDTALKYREVLWEVAKSIDVFLLRSHIGEFQAIRFYHLLYPKLKKDVHPSERAIILKKKIGRFKAQAAGKLFCKELVQYYEAL
jgi:hypothetical protein